jgi:hypothetical protein
MRSSVQKVLPFAESFLDQSILIVVEFPDGLFEVPYSSVYQFGALAAGARGEVVSFHKSDLETPGHGVERDARACSTSSNDQEIVWFSISLFCYKFFATIAGGGALESIESILDLLRQRWFWRSSRETTAFSKLCKMFFS